MVEIGAVAQCGEFGGIGCGCEVAERGVRPRCVVISDPARNGRSGVVEAEEQRLIQEFVPHLGVEGFADSVLHWLSSALPASNARKIKGQPNTTHAGMH